MLLAEDSDIKSLTFLEIPPNPRAASLGESFTALADDVSAVYWNPAGLSLLSNTEIGINYNAYFESMSYFNMQYATRLKIGSLGLNLSTFSYGDIENYVDNNFVGIINSSDLLLSASYSYSFIPQLYLGASIKYISEKLTDAYKGTGVAGDIGVLYKNPFSVKQLRLGLLVQNIGFGPKFDQQQNYLPLNIKLGMAYQLRLNHVLAKLDEINFMVDILRLSDERFGFHYGNELWFNRVTSGLDMALRLGMKLPSDFNFFTSMSYGLGIKFTKLEIDYALINFGELGLTHRIGLNYKFGKINDESNLNDNPQIPNDK